MPHGRSSDAQAASGGLSSCSERDHARLIRATDVPTTRRGLLCGLGAAPLALAAGQDPEPAAPLSAWSVIFVRHAEKGTDDPRDPQLSPEGVERAKALAALLAGAEVGHVFSTDYRRTRDTAAPLAEQAERKVELYDPRQPAELLGRLREGKAGSLSVVVGHSNTTPQLLQELGAPAPAGLVDSRHGSLLPEDCYDRLFLAQLVRRGEEDEAVCATSLELRYGN